MWRALFTYGPFAKAESVAHKANLVVESLEEKGELLKETLQQKAALARSLGREKAWGVFENKRSTNIEPPLPISVRSRFESLFSTTLLPSSACLHEHSP